MVLFTLCASIAILLEMGGPFALVALVHWTVRPALHSPARVSGLIGVAAGAGFFLLAWALKQLLLVLGIGELWGPGFSGWPLLREAIGVGFLAGIVEESIRFATLAVLLRRAANVSPIRASLLFALGWGGVESVLVGFREIHHTLAVLGEGGDVALGWSPLLSAFERFSAILLHAALTAWAARAAGDLAIRRWLSAAMLFVAAVVLHGGLDTMVHRLAVPARRALAAGDWERGLEGVIAMECWFAAGAIAAVLIALRLRPGRAFPPGAEAG